VWTGEKKVCFHSVSIYKCVCYRLLAEMRHRRQSVGACGTLVVAAACDVVAIIIILDNSYG
jgi:hypothetical protein